VRSSCHSSSQTWSRRALFALALVGGLLVSPHAKAVLWPDVPDRIKTDLVSPDVTRRRAAAAELVHLPKDEALPLYKAALTDSDVDVRLAAADGASRRGLVETNDLLLPWLTDPDARLREGACDYFTQLPQPKLVKVLARSLGDTEPKVRLAAVRALGASGSSEAVAPLLARLDDGNSKIRLGVARALARLGDKRAVTPLVSKVQDEAAEVRQAVVRTLGELGDTKAAPALVIALRDSVLEVRIEALAALGRLRAADSVASIAPLSIDSSKKGSPDLRRAALAALGRIATAGAVEAIVRSFGQFEDTGGVVSSPAREAAIAAGTVAEPILLGLLKDAGSSTSGTITYSSSAAASAAFVLGELHTAGAGDVIVKAMRRGDVPQTVALHALASLGDTSQLPICLEYVSAADRSVRSEALTAAARLLDPEHPDGRAVEPLLASLDLAQTAEDRSEIATLLGRTGAERVASVLSGLTSAKDERLRLAAIDALGTLGSSNAGPTLAKLLSDGSGSVRLRAGVALGRSGGADVLPDILAKLTGAAEVDRLAVVLALGGLLERHGDSASVTAARKAVVTSLGNERDLLIVGIGRAKAKDASAALLDIATAGASDIDVRRAVAVALGARTSDPSALPLLRKLAADVDPSVRAQASWSLGAIGDGTDLTLLDKLAKDSSGAVAANAAAALGRIAARLPATAAPAVPAAICRALGDDRPYVRANALGALLQLAEAGRPAVCSDGAMERRLLAEDGNDAVRISAARLFKTRLSGATAEVAAPLRTSLERCVLADPSGAVATLCRDALRPTTKTTNTAVPRSLVIFVAPDDGGPPMPRGAYAIDRPDGLLHVGTSDRRGAVVELQLGKGVVRLRVATPSASPAPGSAG